MIGKLFKKSRTPADAGVASDPPAQAPSPEVRRERRIAKYLEGGRIPWSPGYREYKWSAIEVVLADAEVCRRISEGTVPPEHGVGLDERIVEYPWVFPLLSGTRGRILDAGSVLNFSEIVRHPSLDPKRLTITGLAVEKECHYDAGVSYQFADLRDLPFRDQWFDLTICLSTLEHIGMNNEIYGHDDERGETVSGGTGAADGSHLDAVRELIRVTKPNGAIAISFPVGVGEDHGFFQQFDRPMIDAVLEELRRFGGVVESYFRYRPGGWVGASWDECRDATCHNPHTGMGKGDDGAAHCRAVGCFVVKGK